MRFIIDGVSVPRATNKKDLIEMANQAFKDLQQLISNMSVAEQAASFVLMLQKWGMKHTDPETEICGMC